MKTCPFKSTFIAVFFLLASISVNAQDDSTKQKGIEDMNLQELLNVKIVSASKKSELLFDSPLSASVITQEDIERAGCTSIMEAMRLIPGMIVREQSNGNYDIHLRGMDNVPPDSPFEITSNTTTLVMIDGRPIYSYLRGGTFWETLPIDINAVDKIEVVRGPAAALYGPNAVNGVINIITRKPVKDGLYAIANAKQGTNGTHIHNISLGYNFNDKWSMIVAGNYQKRDRSQRSYFEFNRNMYLDRPEYLIGFLGDTIRNIDERYPESELSMEKYAGNAFINYQYSENVKVGLSTGAQHSITQKVLSENQITPLSFTSSDTRYADVRTEIHGLTAQLSFINGTQNKNFAPGNKYDFNTFDVNAEYTWNTGNLQIKPGLSYRSAMYDDTRYSDTINKKGLFNAKGDIITESASLRAEYKLMQSRLRLIAGVAGNKFNYPDTTYISYQFAATYNINPKNMIRAVFSMAPRSSNIYDTYVDQIIAYFPLAPVMYNKVSVTGNKSLRLLTANMFELGFRSKLTQNLTLDVEAFTMHSENYSAYVQGVTTPVQTPSGVIIDTKIMAVNLPMQLDESGVTLSINYHDRNIDIRPFVTAQHTVIRDYAPFLSTPEASDTANINSGIGNSADLKSTPAVFGGASVNYKGIRKFNINLNTYFYSKQTQNHVSNIIFNDGVRGIDHINAKCLLNLNVSYDITKNVRLFTTAKNILRETSHEFFKSDDIPFMLIGGIHFEL